MSFSRTSYQNADGYISGFLGVMISVKFTVFVSHRYFLDCSQEVRGCEGERM